MERKRGLWRCYSCCSSIVAADSSIVVLVSLELHGREIMEDVGYDF